MGRGENKTGGRIFFKTAITGFSQPAVCLWLGRIPCYDAGASSMANRLRRLPTIVEGACTPPLPPRCGAGLFVHRLWAHGLGRGIPPGPPPAPRPGTTPVGTSFSARATPGLRTARTTGNLQSPTMPSAKAVVRANSSCSVASTATYADHSEPTASRSSVERNATESLDEKMTKTSPQVLQKKHGDSARDLFDGIGSADRPPSRRDKA